MWVRGWSGNGSCWNVLQWCTQTWLGKRAQDHALRSACMTHFHIASHVARPLHLTTCVLHLSLLAAGIRDDLRCSCPCACNDCAILPAQHCSGELQNVSDILILPIPLQGWGIVEFHRPEDAAAAIQQLDNSEVILQLAHSPFRTSTICVSMAHASSNLAGICLLATAA